jgi:nucleoside-diphosphate-sugar epimerase
VLHFIHPSAHLEKILVTGAAGFVGTALCAELRRRSIPHVAAVRAATRPCEVSVGDLDGAVNWSSVVANCDTVVHLAGRVHHMREHPTDSIARYRAVNVAATRELARAAAAAGVRRFIFVSTVKVNGESTREEPFRCDGPSKPSDAYAQSKWEAEQALHEPGVAGGMEIVIVRSPLVYGPGVRANFLLLMQLVRSGVPLPFRGVRNLRSMVALDNLIDFLVLCTTTPAATGNTFLISDQHDLSTPALIRMIAGAMHRPARLLSVPESWLFGAATLAGKRRAADRLLGSLQVDSSPASLLLGWTPTVTVEEGIQRTVNHFLLQP